MQDAEKKIEQALWIAHTLFQRRMATGSTANISFRVNEDVYISGSGTCFGTLRKEEFAKISLTGERKNGVKPSKEYPMHLLFYEKDPNIQGVIHTHSFYSVLYSCLKQENDEDILPPYTPYLKRKVGKIGIIPYASPGSERLFRLVRENTNKSEAFLLKQHGPIVPGKTLMDAFYGLEELEESAKLAWFLKGDKKILEIQKETE